MKAGPNFKGLVCPQGHMCRLKAYRNSNRSCDVCDVEIVAGSLGERCFICEYDLCPGCSSNVSDDIESNTRIVPDFAPTNASVTSGVTEHLPVPNPGDAHVHSCSLPPINVFSIFKPRPSPGTKDNAVQAASLATKTTVGNNSVEATGATSNPDTSPPVLVPMLAPVRRLTRMKVVKVKHVHKIQTTSTPVGSKPISSPTAAASPAGTPATAGPALEAESAVQASPSEMFTAKSSSDVVMAAAPSPAGFTAKASPSEACVADLTPPPAAAGHPQRLPIPSTAALSTPGTPASSAVSPCRADTTSSDDSSVSKLAASPDSPVSRLEAFRTMCRLFPDKKFGVSLGIQCSSPDKLFVDLRVPRTSDNFQVQLPPFGKRNEPTFENPVPVAVDRGWQSARSLGSITSNNLKIFVQNAQVIRMPRDGSCLYHALIHHTNYVCGANSSILQIRKELVGFVRQHCNLVVHGQPLQTWIKWECQCR